MAAKIADCSQNKFLVQAGKNCLDALDQEIKAKQSELVAKMALTDAVGSASQTAKIADDSRNLSDMQATLEQLEMDATRARNELARSAAGLAWPGPISKNVATKLHLKPFLEKFSCYSDGNVSLAKEESMLDQSVWQLKLSILKARMLNGINAKNTLKLNGTPGTSQVAGRAPAQATPISRSKPDRTSEVTGTVREPAN